MTFSEFLTRNQSSFGIPVYTTFTSSTDINIVYTDLLDSYGYKSGPHIAAFIAYMWVEHGITRDEIIRQLTASDNYPEFLS